MLPLDPVRQDIQLLQPGGDVVLLVVSGVGGVAFLRDTTFFFRAATPPGAVGQ